jgi:hypothetical protein
MPISSPAGVKKDSRPIENEGRENLSLNQDVHLMLADFIFWLSLAIRAGVDASRVCSRNTGGYGTKRDSPSSKGLNRVIFLRGAPPEAVLRTIALPAATFQ